MEPLEQILMRLIKASPAQIGSFRQLSRQLDMGADQRREVRAVLNGMVKAGVLLKLKGNRYTVPSRQSLVTGRISVHRDGYGFVIPDKRPPKLEGDVFIPARHLGEAMQGDSVLATLERRPDSNRAEGRIVKILHRRNTTLVGQFKEDRPFHRVIPHDFRISQDILIRDGDQGEAVDGKIVNVEVTRFPGAAGQPLRGRVIEVLGSPGDMGVDIEIMVRKHQIPVEFPRSVLEEVRSGSWRVPLSEAARRIDFRHLPVVTIDGETAKDFDDAVHVELLDNGCYQLGVHIADVDHYVARDSALDREALRRGTSVYFPDRAIPMLPEELSNGICSLKPGEDRLTLSVLMEIDDAGEVRDYRFQEGVIRSRERMTYTAVARILLDRDPSECSRYAALVPQFERMRQLALLLHGKRQQRGSIDFDLPEAELALDESGTLTDILQSERNIAHRIIEEFMLLANEVTAGHLRGQKIPFLYRIHEPPDPIKVLDFNRIAMSFGYQLGAPSGGSTAAPPRVRDRARFKGRWPGNRGRDLSELRGLNVKVTPRDYQKLVNQILGRPEERILSYLMLRSMKQACYSPRNRGHFGLASECYTHFTSPIRRYPDLIVHRILKHRLHQDGHGDAGDSALQADARRLYEPEVLEGMALQTSEAERRAEEAERELIELKKLEFMAGKLGEEYEGTVIHLKREGMVVELDELFVEGFVRIETLESDDYRLRTRPLSLVGQQYGRVFRLGERLRVCVDRIDRFRRRVDLSVVPESGDAGGG